MSTRDLLTAAAADVAPLLLGARLTSTVDGHRVVIRLTEVEAYGGVGEDPGSHAFRRQTPRNATMFGRPGLLYVYFTYGMHWCTNIVVGPEGRASVVLLRAGEVIEGMSIAQQRRGVDVAHRDVARGPARLSVALGLTGDLNGCDTLTRSSAVRLVLDSPPSASSVVVTARTGVSGEGAATQWRFHLAGEPTVSPYRPAAPKRGSRGG